MATNSVFIEQAAAEVAQETIYTGQEEADQLLRSARAHIYHWAIDFQGFEADLTYFDGEVSHSARFAATESRRIEVEWATEFDHRWVRFQLEELLSHREAPEKSKMASQTGCTLGDDHPVYGRKIVFVGDKMGSFYRIKDRRITQIGRSYGQTEFIITIDEHHNFGDASQPRFAAARYTAFYWNKTDGHLSKTETYHDTYRVIDAVALPETRQVVLAQGKEAGSFSVRRLQFCEHRIAAKAEHQER